LARRHYKSDDQAPSAPPAAASAAELAVPADEVVIAATDSAPAPDIVPPPPDEKMVLVQRLAEQQRADELQRVIRQQATLTPEQQIDLLPHASPLKKQFLRDNPGYLSQLDRLGHLHQEAINHLGIEDDSEAYFDYLQNGTVAHRDIAFEPEPPSYRPPPPQPERPTRTMSSAPVSAPVTREAVSMSGAKVGSVTLSPAQREAARLAGVDEKTYAAGLRRLSEAKAAGLYGNEG
jgi:hypothetical protein